MVFIIPNGILKEPSSPLTLKTFAGLFRSMKINFYCLENPTDRRDWQASVHRVAKSRTRLKRLSTHAHIGSAVLTARPPGKSRISYS